MNLELIILSKLTDQQITLELPASAFPALRLGNKSSLQTRNVLSSPLLYSIYTKYVA